MGRQRRVLLRARVRVQPDRVLAAAGGDDVSEFEVEFNENSEFTGSDGGFQTTTAQQITLSGLTPDRAYYIRVLARNSIGSGAYCEFGGVNCPETGSALVVS